jgi:hypothetical protein
MVGGGPHEHGALSFRINAFFAGPIELMLLYLTAAHWVVAFHACTHS